jgi:hypothetical protein
LNKANAKIPPGKEDFQSNENLSMPDAIEHVNRLLDLG